MNTLALTPRWNAGDDWTGVPLLIVTATPLHVPVARLERVLRAQIESDAALFDLVTVASDAGPGQDPDGWERRLVTALVNGAAPDGGLFAPRVVPSIVLLGEHADELSRMGEQLVGWESLARLSVLVYHYRLVSKFRNGSVEPHTVRALVELPTSIMAAHERNPELAIDEQTFLTRVAELTRHGLVAASVHPGAAASPVPPPSTVTGPRVDPPRPTPSSTPPIDIPRQISDSAPYSGSTPYSRGTAGAGAARSAAPPPRPHRGTARSAPDVQQPVFHHNRERIVVDSPSPLSSLLRPREEAPTDAESVDLLARTTDAVSLAYLVFVPNNGSGGWKAAREHRRIALELDRLLATVATDAASGRSMRVAVEVFTAVSPLRRHGILRPAGELVEEDLPKAPAKLYDHARTVNSLFDATKRTFAAFQARKIEVLSCHCMFLSSVPLTDAGTTTEEWDRLLTFARATWVEIDPGDDRSAPLPGAMVNELPKIPPSRYGFHLISSDYDVTELVRAESSALYRYGQAQPAPFAAARGGAEGPPAKRWMRRWWRWPGGHRVT